MGQNTKTKILEIFYENPEKMFTVRELSRKTKLPKSTVHKHLFELKKEGLITKDNLSSNTLIFKTKKANFFIEKIIESGLVDELVRHLMPSCIILFGSIRKGESNNESDIDLFVETSLKKIISLESFERKLKHKVQIHAESSIKKVNPNLLNNIVNGIKLYGSFKIA